MKHEEEKFIRIGTAASLSGLDAQTIRKMADSAFIDSYKTPSSQRRINKASLQKMCSTALLDKEKPNSKKKNFLYARVSTKKQVDDLSRQVEYLKQPKYAEYSVIQDIGSGINFKRKGLETILDSALQGNIGEVIVAHRDRLSRFGFELIELIITKAGGKITVLDTEKNQSSEQDLSNDLLSIIHIFNCRQMGKRSYSSRKNS